MIKEARLETKVKRKKLQVLYSLETRSMEERVSRKGEGEEIISIIVHSGGSGVGDRDVDVLTAIASHVSDCE